MTPNTNDARRRAHFKRYWIGTAALTVAVSLLIGPAVLAAEMGWAAEAASSFKTEAAAGQLIEIEDVEDDDLVESHKPECVEPTRDAEKKRSGVDAFESDVQAGLPSEPDGTGIETAAAAEPDGTDVATAAAAEPDGTGVETAAAAEPDGTGVETAAAAEPDGTDVETAAAFEPDGTDVQVGDQADPAVAGMILPGVKSETLGADALQLDLTALKTQIFSFAVREERATRDMKLNERTIVLNPGEQFQMALIKNDGTVVSDVVWVIVTRHPTDEIYLGGSAESAAEKRIQLSADGLITAGEPGDVQVWAKYGEYLYCANVTIRSPGKISAHNKEQLTEQKVNEIVEPLRHLSDLDKILAVHDYLANHIVYSENKLYSQSPVYDALVEGKAVCYGYARAFHHLITALNIEGNMVSGYVQNVFHAWNQVRVGDRWYYVDVTLDDQRDGISYRYFMLDEATLSISHSRYYKFPDRVSDDLSYAPYAYEKQGVLVHNSDELKQLLKRQFEANSESVYSAVAVLPRNMNHQNILNALNGILPRTARRTAEKVRSAGHYDVYRYRAADLPTNKVISATFQAVADISDPDAMTTRLRLTFDRPDLDLNLSHVSVKGAEAFHLENHKDGTYTMIVRNLTVGADEQIEIKIDKRGLFFPAGARRQVAVRLVREPMPGVIFRANGRYTGELIGLKPGMTYSVGNGVWQTVDSDVPVMVKPIYGKPIIILQKGVAQKTLDSAWQLIHPRYVDMPDWIQAVDATGDQSNGRITGVTNLMEYRQEGTADWLPVPGFEIPMLAPGVYEVRFQASGLTMSSESKSVTVGRSPIEPPHLPEIKETYAHIPFRIEVIYDDNLPEGETVVQRPGVPGRKKVILKNGVPEREEVMKDPVNQIIRIGVRKAPVPEVKPAKPKPTQSKPIVPKPTQSKPAKPKPTQSKPIVPKPTQSKPAKPKPTQSKPTTSVPADAYRLAVFRAGFQKFYRTGETVALAARAEGGSVSYRYQFFVLRSNGARVNLTSLRAVNTFNWVPENPDNGYRVGVDVVDAGGRKLTQMTTVKVVRQLVPKKTADAYKLAVFRAGFQKFYRTGETVALAARAEGGSASYRYQFFVLRSNGARVNLTSLRAVNTFNWVPENHDNGYRVGVDVVDAGGRKLTQMTTVKVVKS